MKLSSDQCYEAVRSKDPRFDGLFFTAVSSTGIYCRPICRVRIPKRENCTFYASAAEAEANGYRPCLKCRPELAPGNLIEKAMEGGGPSEETSAHYAVRAVLRMEESGLTEERLTDLSKDLKIGERQLRRVFQEAFGVSPIQYLTTRRLLTAKGLLTDTALSVTEIALISGFGSIRRFNDAFKRHYGLSPSALRKSYEKRKVEKTITLKLGYRPPFDWESLIGFLRDRAIPGVEEVSGNAYRRTAALWRDGKRYVGWFQVENQEAHAHVRLTVSESLAAVLPQVVQRVRRIFDLDACPEILGEKLPEGIRLPGCFDPFEMSVRAILGQQITVKAARTLAGRIATALGTKIDTPWTELQILFPEPARIAAIPEPVADTLGPLGITGNRCRSICSLAKALEEKALRMDGMADPAQLKAQLLDMPGIGPWTAEYITMRALSWPDAFPATDLGVRKALGELKEKEAIAYAEAFRPWRSYLTISLWNSLGEGNESKAKAK